MLRQIAIVSERQKERGSGREKEWGRQTERERWGEAGREREEWGVRESCGEKGVKREWQQWVEGGRVRERDWKSGGREITLYNWLVRRTFERGSVGLDGEHVERGELQQARGGRRQRLAVQQRAELAQHVRRARVEALHAGGATRSDMPSLLTMC